MKFTPPGLDDVTPHALKRSAVTWSKRRGGGKRDKAGIFGPSFETAKLNGIDPQAWLTDILGRISDHQINRIDELLPWRYTQHS